MLYMIDGKDEADFDLEGKKATGNKNVISDEDDSSAPEESTDTSVTNPDDAQNTTDTNPSAGVTVRIAVQILQLMEMYRREQRIFPVELYRIPINQSLPEEVLKAAVQAERVPVSPIQHNRYQM